MGNSHDAKYDQELDSITMPGLEYGTSEFTWDINAPDYTKVPDMMDILDSTIVMIVATYKDQKFFRCSYLIRQYYNDEELQNNPPDDIQMDKLWREVNVDKPIIKLYELVWEGATTAGGVKLDQAQFADIDMLGENDKENQLSDAERLERVETLKALQGGISGKITPQGNTLSFA